MPVDVWSFGIYNDIDIDASYSGTIAEYRMNNTVGITTSSSGFSRLYIDATFENDILRIFTTPDFANYEDQETATRITLGIDFVCTTPTARYFPFHQGIKIANNHAPRFSESQYEIKVQLPLPKGFDLTFYKVRQKLKPFCEYYKLKYFFRKCGRGTLIYYTMRSLFTHQHRVSLM